MPTTCLALLDAFRRSALDNHPDLNSDPEAAECFRVLCHTWACEKQPTILLWNGIEQRKHLRIVESLEQFSLAHAHQVFASVFTQPMRFTERTDQVSTLVMPVALGLPDILLGSFKMLCFTGESMCTDCSGTGKLPGIVVCPICEGKGTTAQEERVRYEVAPGSMAGNVFHVVGEGLYEATFKRRGDLLLVFQENLPAHLSRDGADLEMPAQVDVWTLMLGGNAQVKDLLGDLIPFKIPAGVMDGTTVRVPGHGLPMVHRNGRGDLILRLQAIFPRSLESHEVKLVRQLKYGRNANKFLPVQILEPYALLAISPEFDASDLKELVLTTAKQELDACRKLAVDLRSFDGVLPEYLADILLMLYHKCQIKGRLPIIAPTYLQAELDQLQVASLFALYQEPAALQSIPVEFEVSQPKTFTRLGKWQIHVFDDGPLNSDILLDRTDYQQILSASSELYRILDMRTVTMVDSYFISLLMQLRRSVYAQGGQLILLGLQALVRNVLQDTHVLSLVTELDTLDALDH